MTFPCPRCQSVLKTMPPARGVLKCRICHKTWPRPEEQKRPSLHWMEVPAPNDGSALFGYHRSNLIDEED